MTREEVVRNLKHTKEKHDHDKVDTFETNITLMCEDVLKVLDNCIEVSKDATNGDMIRALFPNGKVIETEDGDIGYEIYIDKNYSFCSWFDGTWWNAPYKTYKKGDKE